MKNMNRVRARKIRHIGMSTHNPDVAKMAALGDEVEMILFSINPAFDLLLPTDNIENYFAKTYDESLNRIAPEREELYRICEERNVGITVMKGYAGGRLFDAKTSPFGVTLTPIQCLHYALTRPAVASVMVGFDIPQHVADAEGERDFKIKRLYKFLPCQLKNEHPHSILIYICAILFCLLNEIKRTQ